MSRLRKHTIGIALAAALAGAMPWSLDVRATSDSDPHKPRPRSKGEKARNRKFHGRRP